MKEIVKNVLGFICVMSLLVAGGEGDTFCAQLIWTISCICVSVITGKLFINMEENKELNKE